MKNRDMRKGSFLRKLFTVAFLLYWFGFLIVAVFVCIRDKDYGMLLFTLPFWLAGIYVIKKRLLNSRTGKRNDLQIPIAIIVSGMLVLFTLVAGIMLLVQGVWTSDGGLIFFGGFFFFGGFTFVLGALAVKGYFDRCKVDVLGLYIGILFIAIGGGILAMIYQQEFGLWIIIPGLMVLVGACQVVKCLKKRAK